MDYLGDPDVGRVSDTQHPSPTRVPENSDVHRYGNGRVTTQVTHTRQEPL